MTIHPCLIPTLLVGAASTAAAAFLRRAVRKEYAPFLPLLWWWGALCMLPALAYAGLCLPGFGGVAARLNETLDGTRAELLAGAAGVLPGLMWDWTAECAEQNHRLPFGLPAAVLRAISIAALLFVLLIPYGRLFKQEMPSAQTSSEQTEAAVSVETSEQTEADAPVEVTPTEAAPSDASPEP